MLAKMTVKECAELLGKSEQFIRLGLQRDELPFGHAVKMSSRWSYHISRHKVHKYVGLDYTSNDTNCIFKDETSINSSHFVL